MPLGSLSNDDADGNENGKKAIGLISRTTTLHVHHAFFVHFFAVVVRLQRENAWIHVLGGREHKTTTFFSFPEFWYSLLEFNSKSICQHLTK